MCKRFVILLATFFLTSCFHTAKQDVADLKSNKVAAIIYNCEFMLPKDSFDTSAHCRIDFKKVEADGSVKSGSTFSNKYAGWNPSLGYWQPGIGLINMVIVDPGTYRFASFETHMIGNVFYRGNLEGMITDVVVKGGDIIYVGGVEIDGSQTRYIAHGIDTAYYKIDYVIEQVKTRYPEYLGEVVPVKQLVKLAPWVKSVQKYAPRLE